MSIKGFPKRLKTGNTPPLPPFSIIISMCPKGGGLQWYINLEGGGGALDPPLGINSF